MLCFSVSFAIPSLLPLDSQSHALMLPNDAKVDSKDSLENVESKWVGEIAENCQGVKLVLVALKCDLREGIVDVDEDGEALPLSREKPLIEYAQGIEVAQRIHALRYLGTSPVQPKAYLSSAQCLSGRMYADGKAECSAKKNRGVNEAFTEAARVALSVKGTNSSSSSSKCAIM